MRRVALRVGTAFVLGLGLVGLSVAAEPPKDDPAKAPTFPGYVFVADAVGEVVKADDSSVTLRITWLEPQAKNGNNGRRNLSGNHRNFQNPFQPHTNRPQQVQLKEVHHDYDLAYLPQSLVRTRTMPAKTDEAGKKVPHTQKEIDELRAPEGAPAYAAGKGDVTPGTILEVYLIRDAKVAAEKATDADLRIKYAFTMGKSPNPSKDIAAAGSAKDEKKKKN